MPRTASLLRTVDDIQHFSVTEKAEYLLHSVENMPEFSYKNWLFQSNKSHILQSSGDVHDRYVIVIASVYLNMPICYRITA